MKKQLGRNKVRRGKSNIPLTVPASVEVGQYPLNVEYEENDSYYSSNAYGKLWYGYKTVIYCPNVYVRKGVDTTVQLKAYVFSQNDIVINGKGKFKLNGTTISGKVPIVNGVATFDLPVEKYINKESSYSFVSEEDTETMNCIGRSNDGTVIILDHDTSKKHPLVVEICNAPLIAYTGETITIYSRMYIFDYGTAINANDVPLRGSARLYMDGVEISDSLLNAGGYASFDYTVLLEEGFHSVLVEYVPGEGEKTYESFVAEGVLYVTSEQKRCPTATAIVPSASLNSEYSFNCTFDGIDSFEYIQLYLDDQLVQVGSADAEDSYKLYVDSVTQEFQFTIPSIPNISHLWAYPGAHTLFILYKEKDTGAYRRIYLDEFYIKYPTSIQLISEVEYTTIQTKTITGQVINNYRENIPVDGGTITLAIEKQVPQLILSANRSSVKLDGSILFTAQLLSNTNQPLESRTLTFSETGETYTTDEEGKISFTHQFQTLGTIECTVSSKETSYETSVTSNAVPILVGKENAFFDINVQEVFVGESITYDILLTDEDDIGISNVPIYTLVGNNTTLIGNTDSLGQLIYTESTTAKGTISRIFQFQGTSKYASTSQSIQTNIKALPVVLTITGQSTVEVDDKVTYTINAMIQKSTSDVQAYVNQDIDIQVNGVDITTVTTNSEGIATAEIVLDEIKVNTIKAIINESDTYDITTSSITTATTLKTCEFYMKSYPSHEVCRDDALPIAFDTYRNDVEGRITLYLDDEFATEIEISGGAIDLYYFDLPHVSIGTHSLRAVLEAEKYETCESTDYFEVIKYPTKITTESLTCYNAMETNLIATLIYNGGDIEGQPIPNINVSFKKGNTTIGNARTDENGIATLPYTFDNIGSYEVTCKVGENSSIQATTTTLYVTVESTEWNNLDLWDALYTQPTLTTVSSYEAIKPTVITTKGNLTWFKIPLDCSKNWTMSFDLYHTINSAGYIEFSLRTEDHGDTNKIQYNNESAYNIEEVADGETVQKVTGVRIPYNTWFTITITCTDGIIEIMYESNTGSQVQWMSITDWLDKTLYLCTHIWQRNGIEGIKDIQINYQ
ncbi:hypothetical protein [Methanosphaera sp.]